MALGAQAGTGMQLGLQLWGERLQEMSGRQPLSPTAPSTVPWLGAFEGRCLPRPRGVELHVLELLRGPKSQTSPVLSALSPRPGLLEWVWTMQVSLGTQFLSVSQPRWAGSSPRSWRGMLL